MIFYISAADPVEDVDTGELIGYTVSVDLQDTNREGQITSMYLAIFLTLEELAQHRKNIEMKVWEQLQNVSDIQSIVGDEWTSQPTDRKVLAA